MTAEQKEAVLQVLATPRGKAKLWEAMFPGGLQVVYDTHPGFRRHIDSLVAARIALAEIS